MTQYGDYQEPGIVTEVTSALGVPTSGDAPSDIGIVGQANLGEDDSQGSADANTVHVVENPRTAREWFGNEESSLLTAAVVDMLGEGAFPVYAVAAESETVVEEDHSDVTETAVTLDNAPIREEQDSVSVTLDDTELTTVKVYDDPSTYEPTDEEAYYNPVRGVLEVPAAPSTELTVDYERFDYSSGHEEMVSTVGDTIDRFGPITENRDVVDDAQELVNSVASEYDLMLLQAGADISVNVTEFENPYDDSRTQLTYPTRFEDGTSAVAAYAGKCASLGLDTTPIKQSLNSNKRLHPDQAEGLTRAKRGTLIENNVVPLKDESGGARVMDDPTTVTPDNSDEFNIDFGFERLAVDYIIETTRENQRPFIGRLNQPAIRNTLENMVSEQLTAMQESNIILDYDVSVFEVDATTAGLEIAIETAEPLRFIENRVTVGDVA